MSDYIVQPGDCFNKVAKDKGYYNYLTLYNHDTNNTTHTNPNMLVQDAVIKVPDQKTPKKLPLILDKEKTFLVDRQITKLRVALVDFEGKVPKATKVLLKVASAEVKKLGANGLMEVEVSPIETGGTLTFTLPATPLKIDKGKGTKKGSVPAHPPEIPPKDWVDELDDADTDPIDVTVDLKVGYLEPHTEIRGALRRLNNLGCKIPDGDAKTATDDDTKAVVKSYQKFKNPKEDNPTGAIADIQTVLEADHDHV